MARRAASYDGLEPASQAASAWGRGNSKKRDTKPEVQLRLALWHAGCRYRKNVRSLPGKPDIVFIGSRVVVFCDGDFWHGKDWRARKRKLRKGNNPDYWIQKIQGNIDRDRRNVRALEADGWTVLRFWESEIKDDLEACVEAVLAALERAASSRS